MDNVKAKTVYIEPLDLLHAYAAEGPLKMLLSSSKFKGKLKLPQQFVIDVVVGAVSIKLKV